MRKRYVLVPLLLWQGLSMAAAPGTEPVPWSEQQKDYQGAPGHPASVAPLGSEPRVGDPPREMTQPAMDTERKIAEKQRKKADKQAQAEQKKADKKTKAERKKAKKQAKAEKKKADKKTTAKRKKAEKQAKDERKAADQPNKATAQRRAAPGPTSTPGPDPATGRQSGNGTGLYPARP